MTARRGVLVVGGGAAGMVAAIAAARRGAPVELLERMPRVGKKLLVTGNGRCNLANARPDPGRYHGEDPGFARAALAAFGLDETLRFFAGLGIEAREEEAGKIFPRSGQASAVLDVLRHELARLGVQTHCEAAVSRLEPRGGLWRARTPGGAREGAAVVLAAGGRAAPQLGSNGSGHALAAGLGHRIVEPFPALTRVRVRSPWLAHLKGLKVDGRVSLGGATAAGRDPLHRDRPLRPADPRRQPPRGRVAAQRARGPRRARSLPGRGGRRAPGAAARALLVPPRDHGRVRARRLPAQAAHRPGAARGRHRPRGGRGRGRRRAGPGAGGAPAAAGTSRSPAPTPGRTRR